MRPAYGVGIVLPAVTGRNEVLIDLRRGVYAPKNKSTGLSWTARRAVINCRRRLRSLVYQEALTGMVPKMQHLCVF